MLPSSNTAARCRQAGGVAGLARPAGCRQACHEPSSISCATRQRGRKRQRGRRSRSAAQLVVAGGMQRWMRRCLQPLRLHPGQGLRTVHACDWCHGQLRGWASRT